MWQGYREEFWLCRVRVRKAMARLELNLARDTKDKRKELYRYINQKRSTSSDKQSC